jgi:hypothetical protein
MLSSVPQIHAQIDIPILDFSHLDLLSAHQALGFEIGPQACRILSHKLDSMPPRKLKQNLARCRMLHQAILAKSSNVKIPSEIRSLLSEYLACVQLWAEGAKLTSCCDQSATPLELGLMLQDDNTGCQTGFFREKGGSIIFWHTEEDQDSDDLIRVDHPRLMRYQDRNGIVIYSFIYPDLLPGSTFNWRSDGSLQLVDALLLNDDLPYHGINANLFAWLKLHLDPGLPLEKLFSFLNPFFDGYALFSVFSWDGRIIVDRIEFCQDQLKVSSLGQATGSYLFQVNIFSAASQPLARKFERNPFPGRVHFLQRIQRTQKILDDLSADDDPIGRIKAMLRSPEGGEYAYDNDDVKASLLGRVSPDKLKIHAAPGCGVKE